MKAGPSWRESNTTLKEAGTAAPTKAVNTTHKGRGGQQHRHPKKKGEEKAPPRPLFSGHKKRALPQERRLAPDLGPIRFDLARVFLVVVPMFT